MKTTTRLLSLLMVFVMVALALASCSFGGGNTTTTTASTTTAPGGDEIDPYDALSAEVYEKVLGEFLAAYEAAKAETNVSKKFALMAIAEAKLMESAVMLPLTSNGGNYAISRVAPNTVGYALWGNDSDRYHQAIVATEFITAEHRAEMKAKWAELKGTGTYEAWAKSYLIGKGYTLKDSYTLGYSSDPQTWDVLATSKAADSEAIVNTYDGLYEYDVEGTLRPALATGYTVSEDGLKYTFTIREGINWVDSQGRVISAVTADDFVAGMQHMMDAMGGLEYLVQGVIKGADAYINGEVDFDAVGVKAVDTYTLEYTLEAPCSYFMTMLGYGVFAPMNRAYYTQQGGKFGLEYDAKAESYTYGKTPNNIAYCGPYIVTNLTEKNTIVFSQNASYWNKDGINVKTITWLFNDGEDTLKAYRDAKAGTIDGAGLNSDAVTVCKDEGLFDTYAYISATDATSFMAFYNVNRSMFHNYNDETKAVSTQTETDKARTNAAMLNVHFRRALSFAADRASYNAQTVGEDLKYTSMRNSYTPGTFVFLEEAVTVKINGVDTTYPAGTFYGKIMQDQIDADGVKMKVWDPNADDGIGSSDGFDGWYNPANAVEELNIAISELAAQGVEISAENPIKIDLPYFSGSNTYAQRAQSYKQSVEASLGGKVVVNLVACETSTEWYYAGYYGGSGQDMNFDMYDVSGWGPDYGDPSTYLDTMLPNYAGYMTMMLGIY